VHISRVDLALSVADLNQLLREFAPNAPGVGLEIKNGALIIRPESGGTGGRLRPALELKVADCSPTRLTLTTRLIGIPLVERLIRDRALPRALEEMAVAGLTYGDGRIELDLDQLLPLAPARFRLDRFTIGRGIILVTIRDLDIAPGFIMGSVGGLVQGGTTGEGAIAEGPTAEAEFLPVPTVPAALAVAPPDEARTLYDRVRAGVQRSLSRALPGRLARLTPWLFALPDLVVLLWRLLLNPKVDARRKAIASAAIAYVAWPLDFLPDLLPGLGWLDDTTIALLSLCAIISGSPTELRAELWPGDPDVLTPLTRALDLFEQTVGQRQFGKLREKAGV
jgi:uncharacterized membrane protein YkvA (DUF1232 family)